MLLVAVLVGSESSYRYPLLAFSQPREPRSAGGSIGPAETIIPIGARMIERGL